MSTSKRRTAPGHRKISTGISLDPAQYEALQTLADADRRSIAFVIRDAIDEYVTKRRDILRKAVPKRAAGLSIADPRRPR